MGVLIPNRCPQCAISLLSRPEWFSDSRIFDQIKLAYAQGIPRLLSSQLFAGQAIAAITLGKTVYFRMEEQYDPHTAQGIAFLAHEMKHAEQFVRNGPLKFYAKYLSDYLQKGGYGKSITFEAEAYAFQQVVKTQLEREFAHNSGVLPCLQMDAPHSPNLEFIKLDTPPFSFP